jgi:heme exporter protein D
MKWYLSVGFTVLVMVTTLLIRILYRRRILQFWRCNHRVLRTLCGQESRYDCRGNRFLPWQT